jgi:DNA-binding transcriptional LysR family regulator
VSYSSSVGFHPLVPRIIREFREAFPLVTVTLVEGYPDDLIERMRNDQIDVSFVRGSRRGWQELTSPICWRSRW